MPQATDTATKLLDTAQELVQTRGYNAFSYKDLAASVGIRTASIHYHFPTKGDLGAALMARYQRGFDAALDAIDRGARSNKAKLKRFIALYRETESCGAICLCGSLAADYDTLPEPLQRAVGDYLASSERWVQKRVAEGVKDGEFAHEGRPADAATTLLAALQGGLIVARGRGRAAVLDAVQREFFRSIGAA